MFSKIINTSNNLLAIRPEGIRPALNNEKHVTALVKSVHRTEMGWLIRTVLTDETKIQYFQIHGYPPKNNDSVNLCLNQFRRIGSVRLHVSQLRS